ncbi:hypothetical protein TWF281_006716 [Arthrobotrys megalospora]
MEASWKVKNLPTEEGAGESQWREPLQLQLTRIETFLAAILQETLQSKVQVGQQRPSDAGQRNANTIPVQKREREKEARGEG